MKYVRNLLLIVLLLSSTHCSFKRQPSLEVTQRAQAFIDKGVVALRKGALADAQAAFGMALTIADSAAAQDGLGCVELMKGNVNQAEEYFRAAYDIDNSYGTALGHLALVYEIRNNKTEAKKLYERALVEEPENFRNRNNYAALIVDNKTEQARAELYRAKSAGQQKIILDNIARLDDSIVDASIVDASIASDY